MIRALVLSLLLVACMSPSRRSDGGGGDVPAADGSEDGAGAQGGGHGEAGAGDASGADGAGAADGLDVVGEGEAEAGGAGEDGGGAEGGAGAQGGDNAADDGGDAGDAGGPGGGGDVEVPSDHPDLSACDAVPLVGAGPHEVTGRTEAGGGAGMSSRCNDRDGASGPDARWVWVPPRSGAYRISTEGADFDTVLSVRQATCDDDDDKVLQCHDDVVAGEVRWSRVVATFEAGAAVLIVVDGYGGDDAGQIRLTIDRAELFCEDGEDGDGDGLTDCDDPDCADSATCRGIDCPGASIDDVGDRVSGSTGRRGGDSLAQDSILGDASCGNGGGGAPEAVYGFSAPRAGRYQFSLAGSRFDTVLYVRDRWCSGQELACDDDGAGNGASLVTLDLDEGQEIILVIDGFDDAAGEFVLTVSGLELSCDDGVDDDGDGDVDCDDEDCLSIECATGGAWPADWAALELQMLDLVNARRALGAFCAEDWYPAVGPLEMDDFLRLSARLHSHDMGTHNYFEHDNLDGLTPTDRMRAAGFPGDGPTGENISAGYATAAASVEGLMNSPGHCRNIMNGDYRVVGYGFAFVEGSDFGQYWTQNFGGSH